MNERPEIIVIGSLNADLVQAVERLPKAGETVGGGNLQTFSGGKGANQAFAAGRMGARVSMIGQVGSDSFASLLLESLRSADVKTEAVGRSGLPTGTAVILVLPDGENVIVISPGANASVTPALARERLSELSEGSYLLSQLEIPVESVDAALAVAKARSMTTILDPAPARELSAGLLRNVDFLTPNETEARTLLGEPNLALDLATDLELAARQLLALGPRAVVLKLGSRGCLIASEHETVRVPGFRVSAMDTTGAGDVFNGALAAALAEAEPIRNAARFANAAAALSVTRSGAQASVPSRRQVHRFLGEVAT